MLITRSDDGYFAGAAMINWRQMDFTITSLISRWRGTGLTFQVAFEVAQFHVGAS